MGLQEYKRKRNFSVTPEPAGKVHAAAGKSFVIQKHAASRLHYDFRLELDGVLKSWAVPKGPSLDPGEKRLAVHVEDHPLEYGDFEGIIPKGEYGGGTVLLWDRGTWEPVEDPVKGYKKGHLHFRLDGEKLHGGWHLVRLHGRQAGEDKQNWLLFKENDDKAVPGSDDAVVQEYPASVATGRTIEEIAADPDRVWRSNRNEKIDKKAAKAPVQAKAKARKSQTASSIDPSKVPGARKGRLPGAIEPQLATLVDAAPGGEAWIHELKLDGYRVLGEARDGKVRLWTRNGKDWTDRFSPVAEALAELPVRAALLDGEVAVLEPDGTTSFQALQNALTESRDRDLVYFVFDLLHLDGYDLRGATLLDRKEALAGVLSGNTSPTLRYSDHVQGSGEAFYQQACRLSLEGIISKRGDRPYRSGRGKDWLKVKCLKRQEFVIVGFTDPEGSRTGFGALLLGVHDDDGKLVFAGKVGTGFNDQVLRDLRKRLGKIERKTPAFANPPPRRRGAPQPLGRARARRRSRLHRMDARRHPPPSGLPGAARGQAGGRGGARGSGEHRHGEKRSQEGEGHREGRRIRRGPVEQSRQGPLSRAGNHQARSGSVLRADRRLDPAADRRPSPHPRPLPGRARQTVLLPETRQ